jgi:hypothetical protein
MNQEKLLEEIKSLEDNFQVNDLKYKSIHVWPVVRYLLLIRFKQGFSQPGNQSPQSTGSGIKNILLRVYIGFRHYLRYKKELKRIAPQLNSAEVILFGRHNEYTDVVDSKKYNRLIDPFIDYFDLKKIPALKIEIGTDPGYKKVHEPLMFDDTDFGVFYRVKRYLKINVHEKGNLPLLLDQIEKNTGIKIEARQVYKVIENSLYYKELFQELFKIHKPKVVFLSAYYDKDTFGLILACRDLKISTVDIQHGKQGKYHFMYSHWTKIPEQGYSLLPDFFWNWGKESEQNIIRWMKPGGPHKTVVGGNLWMMRWKNNRTNDSSIHTDFFRHLKNYKRVILFSLQPIGSANFPDFIIEAIRQTENDCFWLLRLHPKMNAAELPMIENIITNNKNTEMSLASSLPLFRLLEEASMHITCWSSVAYEALAFNVPTILIHPEAKTLYHEAIKTGTFYYADDLQTFKSLLLADKGNSVSDYILHDIASVDAAMKTIFTA